MFKTFGFLLAASLLGIAEAQTFPLTGRMAIPFFGKGASENILVPFKDLDTSLVFRITPATLSCPGTSDGDFVNVPKEPASSGPLWRFTSANCGGARPGRYYDFHIDEFEYVFTWRKQRIYLKYTGFHPENAERNADDLPEIELDYILDTRSHLGDPPMGLGPRLMQKREALPVPLTDMLGRKACYGLRLNGQ